MTTDNLDQLLEQELSETMTQVFSENEYGAKTDPVKPMPLPKRPPQRGAQNSDAMAVAASADAKYRELARVLEKAFAQSAHGKGKERHANDKAFTDQPILNIARMLPGIGGHSFQIMKKAQEAASMIERGQFNAAQEELLGIIVYAAAAHIRAGELAKTSDGEVRNQAGL